MNNHSGFADLLEDLFEKEGAEGVVTAFSFLYGAFVITKDGIVIGANQGFIDLIQYDRSDLYGMPAFDLITADEHAAMKSRFSTDDTSRYELKLLSKSEEIKTALVSPKMFSVKGEKYRLAEFTDITEMKELENKLIEEGELLIQSQKLAKLGYWSFDTNSNKQIWSAEMYTMLGLDPNKPPPNYKDNKHFFTTESNNKLSEFVEEIIEGGVSYEIELETIKADGVHGWMLVRGESKCNDNKEVTCLFGIAIDITNRRESENEIRQLVGEQKKYSNKLEKLLIDAVRAVALTVEKRDPYTSGHMDRVAELAVAIGKKLGLSDDRLKGIHLGGTIHDIGKIYIPADILNRPGKLSEAEFEIIKTHCQVGYEIVEDIDFPWPIGRMILEHHERLDGSGYPNGLEGNEISYEAQLLAVADVVEAISSHRPYRPAKGINEALAIIQTGKGSLYNPEIVDACVGVIGKENFKFSTGS